MAHAHGERIPMKRLLVAVVALAFVLIATATTHAEDCELCDIGGGVSADMHIVYLPQVVSRRAALVTIVDQTHSNRLPIRWTLTDHFLNEVVAEGERIEATDPRIWSVRVVRYREYTLQFYGRRGDTCTEETVLLLEDRYTLEGECTYW